MSQKEDLYLYGAGGAGRELAFILLSNSRWSPAGFIDDALEKETIVNTIPVVGGLQDLKRNDASNVDKPLNIAVCTVGDPIKKKELVDDIKTSCRNILFPNIIDEHSLVSPFIEWGEGSIVAQPFNHITTNICIGSFVWVNSYNAIGHDVTIGSYTTIFSGVNIGGSTRIGEFCVIGSGAVLRPGVHIGNNVIVGGGAVVVKDVPDNQVVAGNPAKVLRSNILRKSIGAEKMPSVMVVARRAKSTGLNVSPKDICPLRTER